MNAAVLTNALLAVLAVVMAGLGLSLTWDDFRRLRDHPLAAVLALALQVIVLPLVCVGVIAAFKLPPLYAVGLMLLAASPGGITANLFSHLFGGHVAMNLSLTALNTVLSLATLPLIANWAIAHYAGGGQVVPLPWQKLAEVIAVIAVPVFIGMAVRRQRPDIAARLDKPVKALSAVLLLVLTVAAIAKEREALMNAAGDLGGAVLVFNLLSLLAGYGLGRVVRLPRPLCIAIGYEVGIHNSTLALYLALAVLQQFPVALPAALYSVSMYVTALLFGFWLRRTT
ncbi:bile acid:sodium symporter family protein [Roseateles asaccharophilus]|uniref:BASS family bile acid:Na+ symporter n=1 Tax=Roseateles asaccharophilus TaxID=582607 RepID=A0ABU2A6J1_9BURK|nr:bile acid:sodium symporter family protein [Roseateles asaccharophilus]MDR7332816.1 BASS family bile acid:Na+ symporter [Roseateles asaccharophilus]